MNQFEGINSKTSVILPISSLIANKKLLLNTLRTIAYFLITNKPPFKILLVKRIVIMKVK